MPTNNEIRQAFIQAYGNGTNFITPNVHAYGYSLLDESLLFEISQGTGIFPNTWIVGVTVIDASGICLEHLNKVFTDSRDKKWNLLTLAREYGEELTNA